MIELPYFKFFPNQWLTGTIAFQDIAVQGTFMRVCCFYWSKGCKVSENELKSITGKYYDNLIETNLIKSNKGKIVIKWLDEQYKERKEAHNKRVEAGREGGKATAKQKKENKQPYMSTNSIDKYIKQKQNVNS